MRGLKEKMKMQDASVTDGVQYRKASLFDMIASVATNGGQMCFYILIMYASYIGTEGYGIAVATVGVILSITKVFDGVTDALAAALIEKMPGTHGKIRICVAAGFIIESLAVLGLQSVSDLCRAGDHELNVIERNHAMRPRVGGVLTP